MKMLVLDSIYDNKKGIDILKDILATRDSIVTRMGRDASMIQLQSWFIILNSLGLALISIWVSMPPKKPLKLQSTFRIDSL